MNKKETEGFIKGATPRIQGKATAYAMRKAGVNTEGYRSSPNQIKTWMYNHPNEVAEEILLLELCEAIDRDIKRQNLIEYMIYFFVGLFISWAMITFTR